MYQSFPQTVYTKQESAMPKIPRPKEPPRKKKSLESVVSRLEIDDVILIGILLILLNEDSDEWILIALIAFLLFF
ncbi:MAG: hypothetical protein J6A61_00210 [Clostridia bacterium]|nr:hypothetical protein [Clostridia bacterium]